MGSAGPHKIVYILLATIEMGTVDPLICTHGGTDHRVDMGTVDPLICKHGGTDHRVDMGTVDPLMQTRWD